MQATIICGVYAEFVRRLTVEAGAGWMPSLIADADAAAGTVTVREAELARYAATGSSVELSFATLIAAAVHAAGADTAVPEPSGAEVLAALRRGGDSDRAAALLAACELLVER
jgi:hypothetical protein